MNETYSEMSRAGSLKAIMGGGGASTDDHDSRTGDFYQAQTSVNTGEHDSKVSYQKTWGKRFRTWILNLLYISLSCRLQESAERNQLVLTSDSMLWSNVRSAGATGCWSLNSESHEASFPAVVSQRFSTAVELLCDIISVFQMCTTFLLPLCHHHHHHHQRQLKALLTEINFGSIKIQKQTFFNDYIQSRTGK